MTFTAGADPGFKGGAKLNLHSGADETTFVADTYVWLDTTSQIFLMPPIFPSEKQKKKKKKKRSQPTATRTSTIS